MRRIFFLACLAAQSLFSNAYVTYEFSGGRFGDCLLCYLHAKWISFTYDIPLLYKPFKYSEELLLHEKESLFRPMYPVIKMSRFYPAPNRQRMIFECPYFPEDPSDRWINPNKFRFEVDWQNEAFKKMAREMIAPKHPLTLNNPTNDSVNVAVHIREGGGTTRIIPGFGIP